MPHLHYLILSYLDCHNGGPVSGEELRTIPRPMHPSLLDMMQRLDYLELTSDGYVITEKGRAFLRQQFIK